MKRTMLFPAAVILIVLLVIWLYLGIRGQVDYITNIGTAEAEMIADELNISLSPDSGIKSFAYMTYMADSFFVLEIKTDNVEEFMSANKDAFSETNDKIISSFLFPTKKYLPKNNGITAYYTANTVYLSLWSKEYTLISDTFFSLYTEN